MIQSSSDEPGRETLELAGSVWFKSGERTLGGASRIALLAAIHETGSITGAAKSVGMSYKAAWDAVDTMNNLAGEPLVARSTGGKGGGGTTLTRRALSLIDTFRAVEREHGKFLERAGAAIEGFAGDWAMIGRIGMKTSARNQLYGKVASVQRGTVNDEVSLALPGGQTIVAVLTHESTETLGLAEGVAAFALVKASWVILLVDDGHTSTQLSARNQLRGTVSAVTRGAVNAQVSVALDATTVVTAVITNESVDKLGLAEGQPVVAAFKASSVILGVTG
ncbi:TOBE domain-containing protein [Paraburkholderia rhizosphaerae]|uniref:ModE family transcriptional regulator n=1 Tax=Paraburkholderia rhizosphaerae TaxID=480658 RepID=A0A4R8LZA1_9BURK|nr:TOBE domain-containing protein [Paraburkholderia rhizosphaerae]TDY53892.1 ModE family transcriptional regulator [Paraburkholderia rhizosphaerae]